MKHEISRSVPRFSVVLTWAVAVTMARAGESPQASQPVTFTKDIAPLLYKHCVTCHRPNHIAPMSLIAYEEVRPWAAAIEEVVVTGKMPPWRADPHIGEFSNDARLSDAEIATLVAWVKQGAKEGNPKDLPPAPQIKSGWEIEPALVLTIPETPVPPESRDNYEYIYVPTNFKEDTWVQAAEVLPGDRRVVHHATVSVVSADKVPQLEADHASGKTGVDQYHYRVGKVLYIRPEAPVLNDGCSAPEGGGFPGQTSGYTAVVPAIYLPGHRAEARPPGYALRIPAGSYLQFQIHYSNRTGQSVRDRTSIGLVLAKGPVQYEVAQYEIWNNLFEIPPRAANHRVTSCFTLPKDVIAVAYTAHMHYRGRSMTTEATYPDGRREVLFSVPQYDFRWQETYFLKRPFVLPKGTLLKTVAHFDNSANNPLNPDPTKAIRWGEPSDTEMMGFWLAFAEPIEKKAAIAEAKR